MAERIVADPAEVATNRTELDITDWVGAAGIDWGDGEIAAYMADMGYGSSPVDFRVPNRTISIPLSLQARGGTSFATARSNIQAKVARWQQEGGWLKRTTAAGTLFCDVVNASLKLPGSWMQAHRDADVEASLSVEALPDFYGNEVTLSAHTETSAAELTFTETGISGNYPARVRIVVDELQGQSQLGLMWTFRSRNYSSASTARLAYEAEALQPLDTAAKAALSGASGGTVVTHGTLSTSWTPVLGTNIGGTAFLTHQGTYRLFCRYRTTSGTAVSLRAVYDVGDLVFPEENDPWYHPTDVGGTSFFIADLGELQLRAGPVGSHRWAGQIQGRGAAGGENVSLDRLWLQCVDESAGLLRVSSLSSVDGLSPFSARDEFNQTAGALNGKTLPVGGTWSGAGDTDDFALNTTDKTARRSALSDASIVQSGRFALAGVSTYTGIVVQVDIKASANWGGSRRGVFARYVDTSNWLMLYEAPNGDNRDLVLEAHIGGSFAFQKATIVPAGVGQYWTFKLYADAHGYYAGWVYRQGQPSGSPLFTGYTSLLDSGGTLATGRIGFYDAYSAAIAMDRDFDNFIASPLSTDAVLNASQSAELRTDGMFREDTSGSASGPVSWVENDLPRLPVSGLENRPVDFMLKASRGDLETLPDTGIDDLRAQVFYRPCWITVPGS